MSPAASTLFAFALFTSASTVQAADASGQIPGVYVLEGANAPVTAAEREALQLKCLLAPGVMHEDGFGVGYFLDREQFRATGMVHYIKGQEYRCRYSAQTRMETCESKEFSEGKSLTYYRNNVYQVFTPDLQRGHTLLTPEDVVAWNSSGAVNPVARFAYHRCQCLRGEEIEARASSAKNELSSEETGRRLYWWNTDTTKEDLDLARQVLHTSGLCKPDVS